MSATTPGVSGWDVIVIGAGVVGLAHAVAAREAGASVLVLDRDDRAVGASVRNFGHGCVTGQVGEARTYAEHARGVWLSLAAAAGFFAVTCGTTVVARSREELACLDEVAQRCGSEEVQLLTPDEVTRRIPVRGDGLLGGAFLPRDIRVDPRTAVRAVAGWLAGQNGVEVRFGEQVVEVTPELVRTARGEHHAERVVVCVGHDLDRILPGAAEAAGLKRCVLQMHRLRPTTPYPLDTAVLTGSSLLRYPTFSDTDGARALRSRWQGERPELLDAGVNHMITQLPDGDLLVGDTHAYDRTPEPFSDVAWDELIMHETAGLLAGDHRIVQRWQGIYASAPDREFLVVEPEPGLQAVTVTSGIGMTTGFGLGHAVVQGW